MRIDEKTYGPDHANVATNLSNIALILKAQGKLDEELTMYQRAMHNKEKTYGPDHAEVAASLSNIALILNAQGKLVLSVSAQFILFTHMDHHERWLLELATQGKGKIRR